MTSCCGAEIAEISFACNLKKKNSSGNTAALHDTVCQNSKKYIFIFTILSKNKRDLIPLILLIMCVFRILRRLGTLKWKSRNLCSLIVSTVQSKLGEPCDKGTEHVASLATYHL